MTFPDRKARPDRSAGIARWSAALALLLAALFRLPWLQDVPPGLAQDEVLNADIVSFILRGHHALFFAEGYGHEPLYHYWSVPFRLLLGDNVLSIRLPAVFLGMLLVAATMRWARNQFGRVAAIVTGLGLAASWWPIIFSRIGIRPILEPLLLVLAALAWSRRSWLAGFLLGLSLYSYTAARSLLLMPLLWTGYLLVTRRGQPSRQDTDIANRKDLRSSLLILAITALMYLPLELTLRANPDLQQRIQQLQGPLVSLLEGDARPVLESALATLGIVSFTGDPRWTYSMPGRPLFDPLTALMAYAGLALTVVRWRRPRYGFVLIWLVVTFLPSALTPQAPSTVRLVGAMPVIYLLPGIAIAHLTKRISETDNGRLYSRRIRIFGGLLLALVFFLNVGRTLLDGFIRWPAELEARSRYQSVLLDISRHWLDDPGDALVVATGFFEPITADSLIRNAGADLDARWVQTGADVAGAIIFPAENGLAPDRRFYVPEFAAPAAGLMARAGIPREPVARSDKTPLFALYQLPLRPGEPVTRADIVFGGLITLVGYEIAPVELGQPLEVYTYWEVDDALPDDLAVFIHVLDDEDHILTQHDGLDAAPMTLHPGDLVLQRHLLPWPAVVEARAYTMQLGLYTRSDQARLTHAAEPYDRLILTDSLFLTESH